jgi:hypothetical protein
MLQQQEKQDVISKAVAYYREALAAKNPFQEIVTLFSCIQVIVKDACGDTKGSSICKTLHDFVGVQSDQCKEYYGKYRSAADHGGRDIIDTKKMRDAETKAVDIRGITFRLIREYTKRNKQ